MLMLCNSSLWDFFCFICGVWNCDDLDRKERAGVMRGFAVGPFCFVFGAVCCLFVVFIGSCQAL